MRNAEKQTGHGSRTVAFLTLGGCLLALVAVLGLTAVEATRGPLPTAIDQAHALPVFELPKSGSAVDLQALAQFDVSERGRVILDLDGANLTIEPGPVGSPIRLDGRYDAAAFELAPEFSNHGRQGWTFRLRLRPTNLVHRLVRRDPSVNTIKLSLPQGTPISLAGTTGVGTTTVELGGLWIVDTDLGFGMGEHRVAVSSPLLLPMEHLGLDASVGELTLVELGNASPRVVTLSTKAGEACIDLRGAWKSDATIDLRCGVGSCGLHQPGVDDAVIRVAGVTSIDRPDLPILDIGVSGMFASNDLGDTGNVKLQKTLGD